MIELQCKNARSQVLRTSKEATAMARPSPWQAMQTVLHRSGGKMFPRDWGNFCWFWPGSKSQLLVWCKCAVANSITSSSFFWPTWGWNVLKPPGSGGRPIIQPFEGFGPDAKAKGKRWEAEMKWWEFLWEVHVWTFFAYDFDVSILCHNRIRWIKLRCVQKAWSYLNLPDVHSSLGHPISMASETKSQGYSTGPISLGAA